MRDGEMLIVRLCRVESCANKAVGLVGETSVTRNRTWRYVCNQAASGRPEVPVWNIGSK